MCFQKLFSENKSHVIEINGCTYHRYFPINVTKEISLHFKFVESNSSFTQAIAIHFPRGFKGKVFFNEKKVTIKKSAFPRLIFWMDTVPAEFDLMITDFDGEIMICNGSDPLNDKRFCHHLTLGCAMIVDSFEENKYRFNCNDHEYDDDCNDLIFEMEVQKT